MPDANQPKQPPYNATFMGVVVGAANHYGTNFEPTEYYCESGFAYALNIAPELCPSGPYCWNHQSVVGNLRRLGLSMTHTYLGDSSPSSNDVVGQASSAAREALLSIEGLEHQLVSHSDERGLDLSLPWGPDSAACLNRVDYEDLRRQELQVFGFYRIDSCDSAEKRIRVLQGLESALRMYREPSNFEMDGYRFGLGGLESWADALSSNEFDLHGNWWNAQVWSECRHVASEYFSNWEFIECEETNQLAQKYSVVANLLSKAGEKELDNESKRTLVLQATEVEASIPSVLRDLVERINEQLAVN